MSIFAKKKQQGEVRPGDPRGARANGHSTGRRGGFSFGGHRLSSLYRGARLRPSGLTAGYRLSSLSKYSPFPAVPPAPSQGE